MAWSHRIKQGPAWAILLGMVSAVDPGSLLAQADVDPARPRKHFSVTNPAGLSGAQAQTVYGRIKSDMVAGYRLSAKPYAETYLSWRLFNTVPYRSAQHGERFVNNYANERAIAYRLYENSGPMPPGAILVKDSFAVLENGDVFSGPLFVMEKMAPGFNPPSGDWRYTMIMPDGSLLGTTKDDGSARVEFCVPCHAQVGAGQDHMFFVPRAYRVPSAE